MERSERKLYITENWVKTLFVYYVSLFCLGLYSTLSVLFTESQEDLILKIALNGSISISLTASSISYIRKLYKSCFSYSSEQETDDQVRLKRLGTLVYFFTRPIFAVLFSILIVIGLNSGMLASTKNMTLDQGFIYITMFFSFYAGFVSGDFIKKLEKNGKTQIGKLMG